MTDTGVGGWRLRLACVGCSAAQTFRGVVPDLAHDRATAAGWQYSTTDAALSRGDVVDALCPGECACPT